ncbi:MAG: phage terminase large subunit [Sphingomicrobium sp.]
MEEPERKTYLFPISKKEYVREAGALLNPAREGPAEIAEHEARLGIYGYASQFQQTPLPAGGGVFKLDWFRLWPKLDLEGHERASELPQFEQIAQSWDTAITDKETNSYSVCTTWGICKIGYFLLDVWRKHVEFPDMIHAMHALAQQWRPKAILVENKSSGQSAIQELRRSGLPVIAINVDKDKTARARAAAPTIEAGKVWVMRYTPWARLYLDELGNFPRAAFDDQVDSTSQFLNWMHVSYFEASNYYKALIERQREENIREGRPVRYLEPGNPGSAVYVCAYQGCGKEILPNISHYVQSRCLKFCCQNHAW